MTSAPNYSFCGQIDDKRVQGADGSVGVRRVSWRRRGIEALVSDLRFLRTER
jgi:hypothetical protein